MYVGEVTVAPLQKDLAVLRGEDDTEHRARSLDARSPRVSAAGFQLSGGSVRMSAWRTT